MGRRKHEHCWKHVTRVENGLKWICNYCNGQFSGGATRIETHLGGKGGGIRRCSIYPVAMAGNEGVHNNIMASTSSNPPETMINRVYSTQDQGSGVNGSGGNRSVSKSEINQLKQLVLDLECDENDIAKQLQWLESRGKKRKPEVDLWLEELLDFKESVDNMNTLNDIDDINELINDMKQHKADRPLTLSTEFVGKKLDENIKKVFKLLENDKVFVIGIYGMGGVGKTLLATLVENEVKRKETFTDVFWVTVSHNYSNTKLQHDISKRIGLKLDEEDDKIRAHKLYLALEKKGKSILILDDVWKYIDLQKVGVHPKVDGIKVILTTRLKHVCQQMDCHILQMFPLSCYDYNEYEYTEDWELFMLKLGHDGTHMTLPHEIKEIARCIVKRFKGLPLAINVMARTMKGTDDIHRWKHALNKLKKLEMGQEVEEEVFKVLKRSYDNLMEKDLQNCFLYLALLSADGDANDFKKIGKVELIMKLVDKGHINQNMRLEEIFDEGNTILNTLESHSLISSIDNNSVYTHPLVRNMACYMLKESKRNAIVKLNEGLTDISLSHGWAPDLELFHIWNCGIGEISEGVSPYCPKLSTLIINEVFIRHVPKSFFKYMNFLSILDLSYNRKLKSLPNSVSELRSLVSLVLKECYSLMHVPPLGELQALSRLVISASSIEETPLGLEKLINLKWLDLSGNKSLNMDIGYFSSNLTKLQYLDLQVTNALIKVEDIQRMSILECLGGTFDCKDCNQSMQKNLDMSFERIKTYHLALGPGKSSFWADCNNLKRFDFSDPATKTIEFGECDHLSHILPKDLTCLNIIDNNLWVCLCDALSCNTSSLKYIGIIGCKQLESLFCLSGSCSFCTKIHNLEVLVLQSLESLIVVFKHGDVRQSLSPSGMFSFLKKFSIYNCHLIEKLFTSQLVQQLQNLETIFVHSCDSMKEIFVVSNSDANDRSIISLPKLTRLSLRYLPQLKIMCKVSISCRSSPEVDISSCPNLERHPTIEIEDV